MNAPARLTLAPENREVNQVLAACLRQVGRTDEAQHHQAKAEEMEAQLQRKLNELRTKAAGAK